jgi:hypothetical protein
MLRPSDALIEALFLLWLGYSINPIPFPSCQFNNRFLVFENFFDLNNSQKHADGL